MDGLEHIERRPSRSNEPHTKRRKLMSLPKIITAIMPRFRRSKTTDTIPPLPIARHDCGATGADCIPGPSSPSNRDRSSVSGYYYDATTGAAQFRDPRESESSSPFSPHGSSTNNGRISDYGTPGTTPDRSEFAPRPGVLPSTSSCGESLPRNRESQNEQFPMYHPRTSNCTAAQSVRVSGQEVGPELTGEEQPREEKGKAKIRDGDPTIDGKLSKTKERKKSFHTPPPDQDSVAAPGPRPSLPRHLTDHGHDGSILPPMHERRNIREIMGSGLRRFSWSNIPNRRHSPPDEQVGPGDESMMEVEPLVAPPQSTPSQGRRFFRMSKDAADAAASSPSDQLSMRAITASLSAAGQHAQMVRDSSALLSSGGDGPGYCISDSSSPSLRAEHREDVSLGYEDVQALDDCSRHVQAARNSACSSSSLQNCRDYAAEGADSIADGRLRRWERDQSDPSHYGGREEMELLMEGRSWNERYRRLGMKSV